MSGTLKPPTLEESIEILGFDAQDSWKRIISGEGRNVEWVAKWRLWSHRRYLGERAVQVSHAYQLASLFIPTMALAFQEEISTYFLKPVRRPFPQNTNILLYSTLFYATHCSSYFAKWCRKGGDDFKAFLHFMWRYVSQLTIEEMGDLSALNEQRCTTHLSALSMALQYASPPLPPHLAFLPPNPSTYPSVMRSLNDSVARHNANVRRVVRTLLTWLETGGREPKPIQYETERWDVCAGSSLRVCEVQGWENGRMKCEAVFYCCTAHQKQHWAGKGLLQFDHGIPLVFGHKDMCFATTF